LRENGQKKLVNQKWGAFGKGKKKSCKKVIQFQSLNIKEKKTSKVLKGEKGRSKKPVKKPKEKTTAAEPWRNHKT